MADILVIGARGIPNMEGGAEKNAEMLFPLLADAGYSVELVGIKEYIKTPRYKGVKLTGLPTVNILKTDKVIYNFLALFYAVFTRPKIVHLQCLNSALFLTFYKLAGLKVVMRYGSADYEFDKWGLVQRLMFRLCEYQLRFADHVITVSEKFRTSLEERHGLTKLTVIPNGLDPVNVSSAARRFYEGLGLSGVSYVLSVGRVTADKDFETLVDALRGLGDRKVKLIVAGGSEEGYAEKFFEDPDERIHFLGRVDRDLLPALYQNCAAYVNSSRHEGLSNAILEALSYGCPLVLSDIPANREMGLPKKNYFSTGSADHLKEKIESALENPVQFRCPTENFSDWPDVYQRILKVYAEIAAETFDAVSTAGAGQADGAIKAQPGEARHV